MDSRNSWIGVVLVVGLSRVATAANPVCIPLPAEYRVSLQVNDGSAVSLLDALACLLGVRANRATGTPDIPLTVASPSPVPLALAVVEADRALSRAGLRLKRERKALQMACIRPRSCRSSVSGGKPVRVVLRAPKRLAVVTTESVAPFRAVLDEPGAIRSFGLHYAVVHEDVRTLAVADPMAFVSEGAAWPNLLGLPEPGFFITWLRPGGFFERLGLRVGDLVTEVNGYRLGTISEAFAAYGALQEARVLIVRVRRGPTSFVMIVEFRTPGP